MALKVIVDEALCAGRGRCAGAARNLFKLDADGYNTEAGSGPVDLDSGQADDARKGEAACPEGAIRVTDED